MTVAGDARTGISAVADGPAGLLTGRVVLITGAGRGLGAAYAAAVADQGATVLVNDIDPVTADAVVARILAAGGQAVARPADVADWAAAGALVDGCVAEFGRIDGLVNNAGVFGLAFPHQPEPALFRQIVDTNLMGTLACGTAALVHMRAAGSGVVLNVTSGEQMGKSASAVYGATKAAVATLTYSWSADLSDSNVRVNAVSPNAHTAMADVYRAFFGTAGSQNVGIAPEVNAPLVVYLLSDLSRDVRGQVIRLAGRELTLCTHPALSEPVLTDNWTVTAIDEAFRETLASRQIPSGVRRVVQQIVP